jgi:SAM-dependent methyltransferase
VALAFAPSSLFLGVTTFISTDIAAFPLLWVVPLALYLLTFVLVFSRTTALPYRAARQGKTHLNRFLDAHLPKWLAGVVKPLLGGPIELLDPHRLMVLSQPVLLVIGFYYMASRTSMPKTILLLLATFFVTAMVCHGELARSRPKTKYLTEFYIWMSIGGVLGGMFNTLVAPLLFDSAFEFALVIAAACTLRPRFGRPRWPAVSRWLDLLVPCAMFLVLYVLMAFNQHGQDKTRYAWVGKFNQRLSAVAGRDLGGLVGWVPKLNQWLDVQFPRDQQQAEAAQSDDEEDPPQLTDGNWELTEAACVLLLGGAVAFACQLRPLRFGLAVLMVLVAQDLWYGPDANGGDSWNGDVRTIDRIIYRKRSFFGIMRVREFERVRVSRDADGRETEEVLYRSHTLRHGTTDHGEQRFDHGWQREPISYYYRRNPLSDVGNSPLADVFEKLIDPEKHREIGVCGLGTGTTAAYGRRGQRVTYFEIDPAVVEIATRAMVEDPVTRKPAPLFTFVKDSEATVEFRIGDARLKLQEEPDGKYDLLIVDAFSSDAIPVHLLTREAIELYFRKLKPEGILAVHISNRHLELAPVVGNIAKAGIRENGEPPRELAALRREDEADSRADKCGSDWIALARTARRLAPLLGQLPDEAIRSPWEAIPRYQKTILWTDDFSDIVQVLNWVENQPATTPVTAGEDGE